MKIENTNDYRRGRCCVFLLHSHLVFVTKYRKAIFQKKHISSLKIHFDRVAKDFDAMIKEVNGEGDHVHLLVNYPPKISVSKLVNSLKGVSSRMLKKDFPELRNYYWKGKLWSPSYFAGSCGGAPLSIIQKYIDNQDSPKN